MHKEFSRRHYLANKAKYRESCLRWRAKVRQNASNPAVAPITASPSLETTIQPPPIALTPSTVPIAVLPPIPDWYNVAKTEIGSGLSHKWTPEMREKFWGELKQRIPYKGREDGEYMRNYRRRKKMEVSV